MVPLIGNFTLWLSLIFSIYQIVIFYKKKNFLSINLDAIPVYGLLISSLLSFFFLIYSHIISDFSLLNVFQNSHTTKPLFYKISGVWGNHEGSMLLWILVISIFNYFIFKSYNKKNYSFISIALETQGLIALGFILFTILTSNPFEKMPNIPSNGLGFNPILQDPALAIHPPLLYMGYVGFSAVFSLSVATLRFHNNENIYWYNYMKPFVLAAWTFLTLGITLGSVWAYYELGWGGWWFWDPVENASFMPWLIGTALLHSLITVEKKKSLQSWVLLLGILAFLLSVVGTFLVRSGILTSVHTFALDPYRGIYILLFTAVLGFYSLTLFRLKSKKYANNNRILFFSKEGSILVNNILMIVVCATVFLGTIYPLIVEILSNNKISVGEPYYNSTVIPIIIPAIIIMGIGPFLSWGKENKIETIKKIAPSFVLTFFSTMLFFFFYKSYSFTGVIGIVLALWIIFNNLTIIFQKKINQPYGMIIAHLGIGLLILGITGSTVWQKEKIVRMNINKEININNYNIVFKEIKEITKSNYVALRGSFLVYDNKKNIVKILKPENRFYTITQNFTTEVAIHTNIARDIYLVLGEGSKKDGWIVRVYYNPLVLWIWIGAFMIALGGVISMNSNLRKVKYL